MDAQGLYCSGINLNFPEQLTPWRINQWWISKSNVLTVLNHDSALWLKLGCCPLTHITSPTTKSKFKNSSKHHDAFGEFLQIYMDDKSESMQKIKKIGSNLWYEHFENIEQLSFRRAKPLDSKLQIKYLTCLRDSTLLISMQMFLSILSYILHQINCSLFIVYYFENSMFLVFHWKNYQLLKSLFLRKLMLTVS